MASKSQISDLLEFVMKNDVKSLDELQPYQQQIVKRLLRRNHGPAAPKRGIGVHSNSDLFRGR